MSVLKTYSEELSFYPSKTFRLRGDRIEGMIDGLDSVRQAIDLTLSTERFAHLIYSSDYGTELADLIGKRRDYVQGDIQRRITEALLEDDRITGVKDFAVAFDRERARVSLTVITTFGDVAVERSVAVG